MINFALHKYRYPVGLQMDSESVEIVIAALTIHQNNYKG
jgi:hypothetical protein